jgi:hypothetical protein
MYACKQKFGRHNTQLDEISLKARVIRSDEIGWLRNASSQSCGELIYCLPLIVVELLFAH